MVTTIREILNDKAVREEIIKLLMGPTLSPLTLSSMDWELKKYFEAFEEDIIIYVEEDYIDKVYRDIYSHYISTKLRPYGALCLRLLLFDPSTDFSLFYSDPDFSLDEADMYRGFVILRPISPGLIGRNIIDPRVRKISGSIQICTVGVKTTALGYDVMAKGFPHSSQDTQYLTCAETSIWTLMAYYGNKYVEHTPILPSQIHTSVSNLKTDRDVPSSGLNFLLITNVLKEQGFGCLIYNNSSYRSTLIADDFYRIFTCYIESGLPFIVGITSVTHPFGHAVVGIGEEYIDRSEIDTAAPSSLLTPTGGVTPPQYRHWNDVRRKFVFNDDNLPPYSIVELTNPCPQHSYANPVILNIMVPLPRKVYMDAPRAMEVSENIAGVALGIPSGYVLRTFLVSVDAYLNHISRDGFISEDLKIFIMTNVRCPKFIWITEIASRDAFISDEVEGLIILDATEPVQNIGSISPTTALSTLLLATFRDQFNYYSLKSRNIQKISLPLQFRCTTFRNLKQSL